MTVSVRLLVPSSDGARVLAAPNGLAGWQLPRVPLEWDAAWQAGDVTTASTIVRGDIAPVRRLGTDAWECTLRSRVSASGSHWVPVDEPRRLGNDAVVVEHWLDAGPGETFERPEWHDEIDAWVTGLVGPVREARPLRHWELSAVTVCRTDERRVVAKENRRGFDREGVVLDALAGLPHVPELLALDGPRLVMPFVDGPVAGADDGPLLLDALGRFHRSAVDRVESVPVLPEIPADDAVAEGAFAAIDGIGLPDTVVHCDAHPGNLLLSPGTSTIIDWTDAHRGSPLLDLRIALVGHEDDPAVLGPWLAHWDDVVDPSSVQAVLPEIALAGSLLVERFYLDAAPTLPDSMQETWSSFTTFWTGRVAEDRARLIGDRS